MTTCRDCHATVRFVQQEQGGPPLVVDPIPYPDKGNVAARPQGAALVGYVISQARPLRDEYKRYMPHQAGCKPDKPRLLASEKTPTLF